MTLSIDCITFDCADPQRLADFWAAALHYEPVEQEDDWIVIRSADGGGSLLGFQKVPEPKTVKNRVHLDLKAEGGMEAAVERLESLGATSAEVVRNEPDELHTVMRDPEGNEYCVVTP